MRPTDVGPRARLASKGMEMQSPHRMTTALLIGLAGFNIAAIALLGDLVVKRTGTD